MSTALEILKEYYGYDSFRDRQEEIITEIINGNDVLTIMPTGGGKSICYQIPAMLLEGITIVISPLISLMKDQVDNINNMGIKSAYINSSLSMSEINNILAKIIKEEIKILYVAPERLLSNEFVNLITKVKIAQIAVDEAHCVSQWGHDFRSSYRKISRFIEMLPERPIVTAFTATATKEVRIDIVDLLKLKNPKVFISGFDRNNLKIVVEKAVVKKVYLLTYIKNNIDSSGIIYCSTRKDVDKIYDMLITNGINAEKYHAGLSDEERKSAQENFIYDRANIIVATNAFGMGIDKPNIRYVIHYNMPKNIEGYYQEIGRAGRDGGDSECIMLFSPADVQTQRYIIDIGTNDPVRKQNEYEKLQTMINLIYTQECYRKYILNYFGEEYEGHCNNCSNCESDGERIDRTIDAQKVISCVYRVQRPYGIGTIVDVLRGSKNKKIYEWHLDEISTYGIMKEYSKDRLTEFINTLIAYGYLNYKGEYPVLSLNKFSMEIAKGQKQVWIKEHKLAEVVMEVKNDLFQILRQLRAEIAVEEKVPPYMVFGDNTLKELSARMPINNEQILDISGVGKVKAEKYADMFLEKIKQYIEDNNIEVVWNYKNISLAKEKSLTEIEQKDSHRHREKGKSYMETIEIINSNGSLLKTAEERGLSLATIMNHVNQYISENDEVNLNIDFNEFFNDEEEEEIEKVIEKVGFNKLKTIKENVSERITYDMIKAAVIKKNLKEKLI